MTQEQLNNLVLRHARQARGIMLKEMEHPHTGFIIREQEHGYDSIPVDFKRLRDRFLEVRPDVQELLPRDIWKVVALGAKLTHADAVIGVHDMRMKTVRAEDMKTHYEEGEISDDKNNPEFLVVIGKAPGLKPASCLMRYKRLPRFIKGELHGERIEFADPEPVLDHALKHTLVPDFWNADEPPDFNPFQA